MENTVKILVDEQMCVDARAGRHNFLHRLENALGDLGLKADFAAKTVGSLLATGQTDEPSMAFMEEPTGPHMLNLRTAYVMPFWNIETTNKRWEFSVAQDTFNPDDVDPAAARKFANGVRRWRYKNDPADARRLGFVYVPLQGRLLQHRSFQSMRPIDMLKSLLAHESRPIVTTIHPNETYTQEELQALHDLVETSPNLSIGQSDTTALLRDCDYIATQNSGVAFTGLFYRKPCVLFGQIDFHHIAANVQKLGVAEAIKQVEAIRPPYDLYLYWFLKKHAINAGSDDVEEQIIARLKHLNWP